jgi:hypothetical protein
MEQMELAEGEQCLCGLGMCGNLCILLTFALSPQLLGEKNEGHLETSKWHH